MRGPRRRPRTAWLRSKKLGWARLPNGDNAGKGRPRYQYTGFPEASLICDFQVLRIWLVTAPGSGT